MSIYNLSWNESSFLAKLRLFFASIRFERENIKFGFLREQARGYSALSSVYYSIVGSAVAQFKAIFKSKCLILAPFRLLWWLCSWFPLGAWCYWRMLPLSNRVVFLIGYQGMSAEQCDIRQSILRKRGKLAEALVCIDSAIDKKPTGHSLALLLVGRADVLERQNKDWGNFGEINRLIYQAIKITEEVENNEPRQAVRIYRNCADLVERMGEDGELLRKKARQLAERVGAKDQILKI